MKNKLTYEELEQKVKKLEEEIEKSKKSEDKTQYKYTEESLREIESRFHSILENAPFGYYRIGKDGLWQYVNPAWERMHGLSLEEIIGKSFEITQTNDSLVQAREYVRRGLAGETIVGEFSRLTKDGNIEYIEYHRFNIQPVKENMEVIAIEGFINDITDRINKEEALQKSNELLFQFINNIPESAVIIDTNGNIIITNTKVAEKFGKTIDELIGSCGYDLLPSDVAEYRRMFIEKVMAHYAFWVVQRNPIFFMED